MHRLAAIMIKELNQIKRDRRTLLLLLFFPALLLVVFGYAIDFDVKYVKLGILDFDNTKQSREFIRTFTLYDHFIIQYYLDSYTDIDRYLDSGLVTGCIVISNDFTENLKVGKEASIQIIIDGTNSNTGMTALGNLNAYCSAYSEKITMEALKKAGIKKIPVPVELIPRVWYNPELKSAKFLIPGLIGFIMLIVCVVTTSLSIVREKERFTIEQLSVSPIKSHELIIGKTLPYIVISLITMIIIIVLGMFFFDITIKGSILLLFITSLIFIVGSLGLGMMISAITDSQQVAFMVALLITMLPAIILSGFVFPINSMPKIIQYISYVVPLRYFLVILRSIFLKGSGLLSFWDQVLYLSFFSGMMIMISSAKLRKSL